MLRPHADGSHDRRLAGFSTGHKSAAIDQQYLCRRQAGRMVYRAVRRRATYPRSPGEDAVRPRYHQVGVRLARGAYSIVRPRMESPPKERCGVIRLLVAIEY